MRIDMVQPAPLPRLTKVGEGNGASTQYDHELSRDKKDVKEKESTQRDSEVKDVTQEDVDSVNKQLSENGSKIQYRINKELHEVIIQVLDKQTNEVLEEIPPEKFQDAMEAAAKMKGRFVDKKV